MQPIMNGQRDHLLEELKRLFGELAGQDLSNAPADATVFDLGFDSLFLTQASQALRKRFGVKITFRQLIEDLTTLEAIAAFLSDKVPMKGAATTSSPTLKVSTGAAIPQQVSPAATSASGTLSQQILRGQQRILEQQLALLGGEPSASAEQHETPGTDPAPAPTEAKPFGPFRPLQKELARALTPSQQLWLDGFIARYTARTPASKRHTQQHRAHLADPRAVASFKRAWKEIVYPIVVDRSQGAHLWDVDGNDYVDTTQGFGLAMFGHQPDFAMRAIEEQMRHGMEIGPSHPLAGEVAALLCELTGHERATFCNTGSEAVLGAIRIARTVTGRNKIALFSGAYHGINDEVLVRPLKLNGEWRTAPIAPGIIQDSVANVLMLDYGNPESFEILRRHADDLAAVLVEPVQSRRPELQPREFLHELRALTTECGIALIMDEVITGFRCHPGGAQALFGVKGDIATYGKIIGGGLPIGAITGRAEYMDAFDGGAWQFGDDSFPGAGVTFFAGTFVRHPLALAAAKAVLLHLKDRGPSLQNELAERTSAMIRAIEPALEGTPFQLPHFASLFYVRSGDFPHSGLLYALLRHRGIHIWEGRPCFLGTAHSAADIAKVVAAFHESLAELKAAGFFAKPTAVAAEALPLTDAQREVWVASQMSPGARAAFNETCTLRFHGNFDEVAMRRAITEVIRRHDALRASFRASDGAQIFADSLSLDVPLHDFSALPAKDRDVRVEALLGAEGVRAFDLERGPLVAFQICRLSPDEHLLVFTAHHITCDGWSYDIILRELAHIYTDSTHALPPARQFASYVHEEAAASQTDDAQAVDAYWREQFRTVPPPLELPTDRPRPRHRTWAGARCSIVLPPETKAALMQFGAASGTTLFAVLLAGFKLLLHRLSGATDIVVGIPAAGQNLAEGGADLVGHCANLLPIRTHLDAAKPFTDLLAAVRHSVLDAFENQQFTFGRLLASLPIPRDPGRVPLVPVIFNLDPALSDMRFAGLTHEITLNPRHHYQFDLGFNLVDEPAGLRVECDYNPDLFDDTTILRWLEQYAALLRTLPQDAAQPSAPDDAVLAQVLAWGRGARTPYPAAKTIHALFKERAAETPDAIALIEGQRRITYAELDAHANRYANHLRKQGLGEGAFVGLFGNRYWQFIAATLGILKIGAAYVPLDPRDPAARIAALRQHLDGVIEDKLDVSAESAEQGKEAGQPKGAAYVMFTSGSTGEPKGVIVSHQGVTRLVCGTDYAPFDRETVMMQGSNLCFDAATFELWGALLHGGTLVFTRTDTLLDHRDLSTHIAQNGINTLFLTTSLFNQLARQAPGMFAGLRCVVFGGEAADPSMVNRVLEQGRPRQLVNGYGPTETTTFAVCHQIGKPAANVPIGRPIANTDVFLLDERRQLVAPGVAAEIYIGGPGVALGYLHRPEFTAERFVETEFGRLYRTGDFGRWLADGTIEYQGRIDQQFKLRGFRIEPAEIEEQLRLHPAVAQCAVLPKLNPSGEKVPVAYLVRRPEHPSVGDADFRYYLVQSLPPPFVPYQWFWLEALPLTANGKLDHRALPEPTEEAKPMRKFEPPQNPVQTQLVSLWEHILKRHPIGITDDFFDLGGHSLIAIQLISRIRETFQTDLPIHRLFSTPTVAGVAEYITAQTAPAPATRQFQSLLAIQKGNPDQRPFFLVPGGWGAELEFLVYGVLARHVGADQPFYGLKARGSDGVATPHHTLAQMVADYVAEIRTVQPHGPYLIGGECVGGVAAYEIARALEVAGEKVALLALLGTRPPSRAALRRLHVWDRAKDRKDFWQARIVQPFKAHMQQLAKLPLGGKIRYLWTRLNRKRSWNAKTAGEQTAPLESRKLLAQYPRMLMGHKLGAYTGRITLLIDETSHGKTPNWGWENVHRGELEVHVLPGTHLSYIRENAAITAEKLRELLTLATSDLHHAPATA